MVGEVIAKQHPRVGEERSLIGRRAVQRSRVHALIGRDARALACSGQEISGDVPADTGSSGAGVGVAAWPLATPAITAQTTMRAAAAAEGIAIRG